ncbi:MAG: glycosyltransferase family 2 protein [Chloroflexi bacterium]|nr:glycosyltransferase family 2 protein [Chloroflexota bacterium]
MFEGKRVGVTVPAYNEESFICSVVSNMPSFVDRIYVVNDASTDNTCKVVSDLCLQEERLVLINHEVNKGVGAAISIGYAKCLKDEMDIAVVMAGDDQMDPAELPSLLEPIVKGEAGYSKGNRMSSVKHMRGMSYWRRFGNWLLRGLTRISSGNYQVMDPQNGYTAISAEALRKINIDGIYSYYGYCNDMLAKLSVANVTVVEVTMPARYQGEKSKIRYDRYVIRVSGLLLRNFIWRMRMKTKTKFIFRRNESDLCA